MSLNEDMGVTLWILPAILAIMIVHSVVPHKRRFRNGEENEAGPEAVPKLRNLGQRPENENVSEVWS